MVVANAVSIWALLPTVRSRKGVTVDCTLNPLLRRYAVIACTVARDGANLESNWPAASQWP